MKKLKEPSFTNELAQRSEAFQIVSPEDRIFGPYMVSWKKKGRRLRYRIELRQLLKGHSFYI